MGGGRLTESNKTRRARGERAATKAKHRRTTEVHEPLAAAVGTAAVAVAPTAGGKRAAAVVSRNATAKMLEEEASAADRPTLSAAKVPRTELRAAVEVMILRRYADVPKEAWPEAAAEIAPLFSTNKECVLRVFEAVAANQDAKRNKPGQGRPAKIQLGTKAADRIMGGLAKGYGQRWTAGL
eukprot:SAG31_NODE_2358_length_5873_cov_12.058019_3_plen_182_part_00